MWEQMSLGEYAQFEIANNARVNKHRGIWWRQIRPFFYRPLFPLQEIPSDSINSFFTGYQHLVPEGSRSNSYMNFFIFDNLHRYTIDELKHDYRKNIRKGMKHFDIVELPHSRYNLQDAYPAYLSFYQRTHYGWDKSRKHKMIFESWSNRISQIPKVHLLGALDNEALVAIAILLLVENVIIYETFFCHTSALTKRVSELMLHYIRNVAAKCKEADILYLGSFTNRPSIDTFKLSRGCRVISRRACYHIHPLMLHMIKLFKRKSYQKVIGSSEAQLQEISQKYKTTHSLTA